MTDAELSQKGFPKDQAGRTVCRSGGSSGGKDREAGSSDSGQRDEASDPAVDGNVFPFFEWPVIKIDIRFSGNHLIVRQIFYDGTEHIFAPAGIIGVADDPALRLRRVGLLLPVCGADHADA